ncbi:MAG: hypothetical protein HYX33_02695 [Actinobacteria bacterium]|nr:hypothetical protein [Actinomycetota bacterium]
MRIDELFGLPAHPLLVHIAVVFIPLTLVLALVAQAWPVRRKALSLLVGGAAAIGLVGAQLAVMSGSGIQRRVDSTPLLEQHADLGEATRTFAIVMFLAAVVFAVREHRARLGTGRVPRAKWLRSLLDRRVAGIVASVVLIASAALTTTWAIRTGHAGAKATWSDLPAAKSTAGAAAQRP